MTESSIAKLFKESGLGLIDRADAVETLLEKEGIPIVPSLVLNGKKRCVDGQFFLCIQFDEGKENYGLLFTQNGRRKGKKS